MFSTAVEQHNIELAALTLEAGADPNTEEHCIRYSGVNSFFDTLFQWACVAYGEDMVRLFLDHGVDLEVR
jgi:ankyrin repeat protein